MQTLKGLPKAIIQKYGVTKKAWEVYRGKHTRKNVGKKVMARRRSSPRRRWFRRTRHRKDNAIPLAATAGIIAIPFAHGEYSIFNRINNAVHGGDTWDNVARQTVLNLTGYNLWDGSIHLEYLMPTYAPAIVGTLVSKFIGGAPLNLNRKIPKVVRRFIKI